MSKNWKILVPDKSEIEKLSRELGVSKFLAWLLLNREIKEAESAQRFLSFGIEDLANDLALNFFEPAGELLAKAIISGKKIGVHGDYDVDGITATALLIEFLKAMGVKGDYYLPKRIQDGYGLSLSGVEELFKRGVNFLVAVDCGITDFESVNRAKELGMVVLIIDHHQPLDRLPEADLILDPHCEDFSELKELCSAGLVFFLLLQTRRILREKGFFKQVAEPNLKKYLDLVALGTVADVAPALGLNRIILGLGLKEIEQSERFGLRVLKKLAGVEDKGLGYQEVAFFLAPRLNAAGRIKDADPGLELLISQDAKRVNQLAEELEQRNRLRQKIEERIFGEAIAQIESWQDFSQKRSIVVAGKDWHPGVIGIVAQRLKERYFRPSIVISLSEGIGLGSGRSLNGFDLYQGLARCKEYLLEYGGHKLACGLSLKESALEGFQEAFERAVLELAGKELFEEVLICDAELPLYQISPELIQELEKLKPYGPSNPEPVLVARSVVVLGTELKKEKHLWLLVREESATFSGMFFRANIEGLKPGGIVDLAYSIERSFYKGEERVRLIIKDLKRIS